MGMNDTPGSERIHIGFFGRRNAGKSSLLNAVTGQELAVVSEWKGTTTDPVMKSMELLPLGPVVMIDTPGYDDEGSIGELRVRQTRKILNKTDIAVLVVDASEGMNAWDRELLALFEERNLPRLVVYNKADLLETLPEARAGEIYVSAEKKEAVNELKGRLAALCPPKEDTRRLVGDLLKPLDQVLLVIPIDQAAPRGRLILPQQQVIRDVLESGAAAAAVRDSELPQYIKSLAKPPALVITDSQVFEKTAAAVPPEVPLTSFSILMARYKGFLETAVKGAEAIRGLKDGDRVLIAEGCTHHRQCDDIGSVKLPRWLREYTGIEPEFRWTSGTGFPEDLSEYALVIHCGGCMLNEREMKYRMESAGRQGIPFTNYGIAIACMKGILARSIEIFDKNDKTPCCNR